MHFKKIKSPKVRISVIPKLIHQMASNLVSIETNRAKIVSRITIWSKNWLLFGNVKIIAYFYMKTTP